MLHAITRGKSNIYRRYLGHREDDEIRVSEEDELTALLLGPLALLPRHLSAMFWRELLRKHNAPGVPEGEPVDSIMKFWPSRLDTCGKRIEPDLQVDLSWPNGKKCIVLVELKWRAPLSGEDQLHRQWSHYLLANEREKAWHIFIGRETSEALKALGKEDVWNGRLLPISWAQMIGVMEEMVRLHEFGDLKPWLKQITLALDLLGIRRFQGFNYIRVLPSLLNKTDVVFWKGFSGFSSLEKTLLPHIKQPVFFTT